jgi:hypothetical protein
MKNPILFFFLLCFSAASAQKVAAIADKDSILIGERFALKLSGEFAKGQTIPWIVLDSINHFEILERSKVDTIDNGSNLIFQQVLTLTSWDSGKWSLPPFLIGKSLTKPIQIKVGYSVMAPNQDYNDIKEIIPVKKPVPSKWYWYFIMLIVLIALFMLFFPPGKKKEAQGFVPDEVVFLKAMRRLDALEAGEIKEDKLFFTELVNVLREYLQKRKNIHSYSKTSDDLAVQMKVLSLEPEHYSSLLQTLRLSDFVKYAKYQASGADKKNSVDTIREIIKTIENSNAV